MKQILSLVVYLFLLLLSLPVTAQQTRPNILVIFSDDHADQTISAYGSRLMQTPNIDRIAREGAILRNVFVTNSLCAPSRAVLLTGKYSHLNGLKDNDVKRSFDGSQQQVQKLLATQQYQTAWIGKWHLQTLPQGFDFWRILPDQGHYYQPDFINMTNDTIRYKGYVTNLISEFSLNWLNQRDTTRPFFLVVGEKATHRSWLPDIPDLGAYDAVDFPEPATFHDKYEGRTAAQKQDMLIRRTMSVKNDLKVRPDYDARNQFGRFDPEQLAAFKKYYDGIALQYDAVKNDSARLENWKFQRYLKDYLATAKSLDRNIGRILQYLDVTGLAKNTVVIYASDQGFYMGEHGWFDKRFMYEESFRTPFVMRYPGQIIPGTSLDKMVVNIDFAPTILDIAGIKTPLEMQGKSFLPLLTKPGEKTAWRTTIYYHYYEYPEPHRVAPHFGIRTATHKLIRFYGPDDNWELFDLTSDPAELKNLYGQKGYELLTQQLKAELQAQITHYQDTEAAAILAKEATAGH
ncbi:MAG TPA: sulfatase [Sediminibacterium sp.]